MLQPSYKKLNHCIFSWEQSRKRYGQKREEVERILIEELEITDGTPSISVSLDRVSVPMEELRQEPQRSPEKEPERSPKRKVLKRSVQRVFRMAYAATVTVHDAMGKSLCTLRYGRRPQGDIDGLCTALADDAQTLLRRCPSLLLVLLCDGSKELWNRLGAECTESSLGHPVHRLVDLWHLLEKLGSAAKVFHGDEGSSAQLASWRLCLLNEKDAVEQILRILRITASTCGIRWCEGSASPSAPAASRPPARVWSRCASSAPTAAGKQTPVATSSTSAPSP
ncbi:MAG: hypothetical protein JNM83_02915 [Myxococcales bacterium]|nr:hypothetical protein [Myxococcales bacterium]